MNLQPFAELEIGARVWPEPLAGYYGPLARAVGAAFGTATGPLVRLARRRSRLATTSGLTLLCALASGSGRQSAFDIVTWTGLVPRSQLLPWSIPDDQIAVSRTIISAFLGSCVALYGARRFTARLPACPEQPSSFVARRPWLPVPPNPPPE